MHFDLRGALAGAAFLLVFAGAQGASAQDTDGATLGVAAGYTSYDLSGTGNTASFAVRSQLPISRYFLIEPSVGYMQYGSQFGADHDMLFPEVQVQAQARLGRVRPYLGVGGGMVFDFSDGGQDTVDPTLSTAVGVRTDIAAGWSLGVEGRVRAVDPWSGVTSDVGLTVSRRL